MKDILNHILKHLNLDAETVKAITAADAKAEDVTKIFDEKIKAIEDEHLEEVKKGLAATVRAEVKEEVEKGAVPEALRKFKKDQVRTLGLTISLNKAADMSAEDYNNVVKDELTKGADKESEELIKIKETLQVESKRADDAEDELKTIKADLPVKYIEKSIYDQEKIEQAKLKKVAALKDLPFGTDEFLDTLDGRLRRKGLTLGIDDKGDLVPMKDGKPLQDDKFKLVPFDTLVNEVYESVKPKSGGTPGGGAGGGGGTGDDGKDKYVSPAQLRMQGEEAK